MIITLEADFWPLGGASRGGEEIACEFIALLVALFGSQRS
jgi:hypothetical protein